MYFTASGQLKLFKVVPDHFCPPLGTIIQKPRISGAFLFPRSVLIVAA
ncbi:hypothetical protein PRUB_a2611 [Pseudoalteromonas rubra]|uniref:Uncharacterized protein n=1 Tax=Pseudoalteromonas rubra TaxID=43658 RepID=A0A8T0CDB0_9GAMM|nr:hypothetical protein PRUB_a2606 [Pseudoalteromonas rubra]KAF7788049.1 hypothetical protein PRUB_a2607 [Pseudoalteromonas rubra]KAF7788050.1 hypothetical protein PRUB_a2608 [Pseudoalteromonas rubra]KAF7788051.1 hypothetical protein PRUB_a2609 [Pseudoalteromonas rubra]KAF7788052.1 hypothetical protein PRUB_a2610 [Pseudoalteromonas rubra]